MNTAFFFFFPSTSDRILWPQLRKALKHILISILSIYLKLSACLSAALSGNTFWVCSLVLSLFWCFVFQNCVNAVLLTPSRLDTFWPPPMNWVLPASHSLGLFINKYIPLQKYFLSCTDRVPDWMLFDNSLNLGQSGYQCFALKDISLFFFFLFLFLSLS